MKAQNSQQFIQQMQVAYQSRIDQGVAHDPWRVINGRTYKVDKNWVFFEGQVSQVLEGGIILHGVFFSPGTDSSEGDFFVQHFPFKAVDNSVFGYAPGAFLCAKDAGTFTFITVLGATRTITKLDYGIPCAAPAPTDAQIKAVIEERRKAQEKAAQDKIETAARLLKWQQSEAAAGNPRQQYNLGLRYLHGDGVAEDPPAARVWLAKAAAQGDPDAKSALENLPTN